MKKGCIGALVVVLIGTLSSCWVKHDRADVIPVDLSLYAPIDDFFEDTHSITLATGEDYLIKNVDKILIKSDAIYILDRRNSSIRLLPLPGWKDSTVLELFK
ncbi:MAG: 6-bladed beta-propeller [Odoribacteraceae bacterium]|jgi:hypothetical protein|nr:6-bladed beta-propeller [Odoribacteraceae bacterium]